MQEELNFVGVHPWSTYSHYQCAIKLCFVFLKKMYITYLTVVGECFTQHQSSFIGVPTQRKLNSEKRTLFPWKLIHLLWEWNNIYKSFAALAPWQTEIIIMLLIRGNLVHLYAQIHSKLIPTTTSWICLGMFLSPFIFFSWYQ